MRNTILGAVAGLIIGSAGALAYSHYVSESELADLQAKLDAANAALAKSDQNKKELAQENSSLTSQVDSLQASNQDLKQKADSAPTSSTAPAIPQSELAAVAGVLRDMMRGGGGFRNPQQRMLLLQTRLKLSPEQADKISAALQADERTRRDMFRQMFSGGKVDPAAANTAETTLQQVLNPEQLRQYAQLQTDEKNARADTTANSQVNSVAPLLQLSDSQKDQVYAALYQLQQGAPDPMTLMGNPNAMTALKAQADATTSALQKVLSPDQMSLYQQQQSLGWQPGRQRGGNNGGGNNAAQNSGGNGAGGSSAPGPGGSGGGQAFGGVASAVQVQAAAPAPVAPANPAPAAASASTSSPDSSTNAASTNSAPATNAAPSQ